MRAKIRIECIVRSSTRALRDRRLNSLYRRIIASENIGCAGITNGRGADEMHDRRGDLSTHFIAEKNILWTDSLRRVSKRACTLDNTNDQRSIHVLLLFFFVKKKSHLSSWINLNITGFKHIKILKPSHFVKFSKFHQHTFFF